MSVRKIAIAIPTLGTVDVQVVASAIAMNWPLNCNVGWCWPVGMDTATARERTVESAIKGGYTHVFFLDYDVVVPKETITMLARHDAPIACGLYYTKSKPPEPLTLLADGEVVDGWTHGDVVPVELTGLGCALIDLSVFDGLDGPWFQSEKREGHRYTEDSFFYNRVREAKGIKPLVDTGVCCAHKDLANGDLYFWSRDEHAPVRVGMDGVLHKMGEVRNEEADSRASGDGVAG